MRPIYWHMGPFSVILVGRVWSVEIGRAQLSGIGRAVRFRWLKQ